MNTEQLIQVFHMSGYATYVWSAFGITIFCLIALFISSKRRLKKAIQKYNEITRSFD